MGSLTGHFLPYQLAWLNDRSRLKIAEKSRRIGWTYVQAYEDARDAALQDGMDVWFSSADESAAREYILYVQQWAQLFNLAAEYLGEVVISKADDIKALSIRFASNHRVNALSSTPKAFRSKGGKLVLDEYGFHPDPDALWRAASPIITWGYPARVISTHNGMAGRYYRMVDEARKGNKWSLHSTTIVQAIDQGLVDKILKRRATQAERDEFLADCRATAGDEETFQQEYMCQPIDAATAWLSWDLLTSAEHPQAGDPEDYQGGPCFIGMDIGRRRDLTVIEVDELIGDVFWTREVVRLKGRSFAEQDAELDRLVDRYDVKRISMDQTGIGEKPVEDAKKRYKRHPRRPAVEGVIFSSPVKQELATLLRQSYEDRRLRTPPERAYREAHHAVRKVVTAAGNPRFDADRSEVGHADEFWAHALAVSAATQPQAGKAYYPMKLKWL